MRALRIFWILVLLTWAQAAQAAGSYVRLFGFDRNTGCVVLYAEGPLGVKGFHLDSPERWVVDVPAARYSGATQTLQAIAGTPIRGVRIAQFKGGVVRVVFDLERRAEFPYSLEKLGHGSYRLAFKVTSPSGDGHAQPSPAPRPTPRILATVRPTPPLRTPHPVWTPTHAPLRPAVRPRPEATPGLSLHRVGGSWELSVTTSQGFSYVAPARTRNDRLIFDLQGAGDELPRDSLYVDNGLIARVRVVNVSRRATRLILEFDQPVRFHAEQSANHRTLRVSLSRSEEAAVVRRDDRKRVTIDPGHGGEDPGTLGISGVREKDVTLQMALRLQRLMQDSGMDVQMTRTKDMQILLHPRVDVGDAFDSDVFISIHANHVSDPRISGIETYYFTPRSLTLARAVHKRMIQVLHRPDRGVRRNNFVVVKYNKMPACLVEVGYLSNRTEERLLTNPAYQQRAAEAILAGVQDFFKSRNLRQ